MRARPFPSPRASASALTLLLLCSLQAGLAAPQAGAVPGRRADLALVGATIITAPGEQPIRDGVVLIAGSKIAAVGSRALLQGLARDVVSLDCAGLTLVPGFWNSHVHFFERKWSNVAVIPALELSEQLREMLTSYGFTTVYDLSSEWDNTRQLRARIESGELVGPAIRSTGEGLISPGGMPSPQVLNLMGVMRTPLPEIGSPDEAIVASARLLDAGVDGIKIFLRQPSPDRPAFAEGTLEAAVAEAHRRGKPVFAHANSGPEVLAAVRAGVDVIAHTTPHSGPWDEAIIAAMRERKVALIPTLALWKYFMRHDRLSSRQELAGTAIGQLRAWLGAGGTVLFGTDAGALEYDPSDEYAAMALAGMSFAQILASLTTAPAERFGAAQRLGRIAPGFDADLVLLESDPVADIRALAAVRYTLRAGKVIYGRQ